MEKLNLPIIREGLTGAKHLSMDDYLKFVELNLKLIADRNALRKQKMLAAINVPFELR
jgi:hypothetical protein